MTTLLNNTFTLTLIFLVGCLGFSYSGEPSLKSHTKDGFGSMLCFTEDLEFPKKFHEGGNITLDATTNVSVGKPFLMVVTFFGPGLPESKEPQLTMDILISKPDGTKYMKAEGAEVWFGQYRYSESSIQLANSIVKITIEPGDPIGSYKAEVKIKDAIKNVEIDLEKEFTVTK